MVTETVPASLASGRWSETAAREWYKQQPWLNGLNYIPATSINYTEMWQRESYDRVTIHKELTLAKDLGFNCLRVVLQYLVWENQPKETLARLDDFLGIAAAHGMRVMVALFDDCAFGTKVDPYLGPQAEVVSGFYANDWSPSPGHTMVRDPSTWPKLRAYVEDVVGTFAKDERVVVWDLYNEPSLALEPDPRASAGASLVTCVTQWARAVAPTQPCTVAFWRLEEKHTDAILAASDVVSFHHYLEAQHLLGVLERLQALGRPVLCTEWLNRPKGSTVATILPVLFKANVGSFFWGLVNGKTQTHYPWGSKAGAAEPTLWQHDLFRPDHTPYDATELDLFRQYLELSRRGRGM
jgi:hypothetical protein